MNQDVKQKAQAIALQTFGWETIEDLRYWGDVQDVYNFTKLEDAILEAFEES